MRRQKSRMFAQIGSRVQTAITHSNKRHEYSPLRVNRSPDASTRLISIIVPGFPSMGWVYDKKRTAWRYSIVFIIVSWTLDHLWWTNVRHSSFPVFDHWGHWVQSKSTTNEKWHGWIRRQHSLFTICLSPRDWIRSSDANASLKFSESVPFASKTWFDWCMKSRRSHTDSRNHIVLHSLQVCNRCKRIDNKILRNLKHDLESTFAPLQWNCDWNGPDSSVLENEQIKVATNSNWHRNNNHSWATSRKRFFLCWLTFRLRFMCYWEKKKHNLRLFQQDAEITVLLQTEKLNLHSFIRCYFNLNSNRVNVVLLLNRKEIWSSRSSHTHNLLVVDCSCSDDMKWLGSSDVMHSVQIFRIFLEFLAKTHWWTWNNTNRSSFNGRESNSKTLNGNYNSLWTTPSLPGTCPCYFECI
jgi:hypothetical protein